MSTNCSVIIISDGCSLNTAEYVERISDSVIITDPAGDTLILQDYNPASTPIIPPTPPYVAENVANKKTDLLNPDNTTYPTTLAVANALISGTTYELQSPAVISVGGITAGMVLTGKTLAEIIQDMLVPELFGSITAPSTSISLSTTGTFEVGCTISQTISGTFNRGCINPKYCSISDKRSGCVTAYSFTGTGMPVGWQSCITSPATQINPSYTIINGSQSWGVCSTYEAGLPALGSKNTEYCTALPSGNTSAASSSVSGIYPYYYGKVVSAGRPAVTNELITGGTKSIASSTGTVTIDFNSASNEFTWLAIPAISTSKTCWYVNALDNGRINNLLSDKYPDECILSVSSGQYCWSGINYKIYMSGAVGAITDPIQFRNN